VSGFGVVLLVVLVAGGLVWATRARGRTRERQATLDRLAPLISGTSKDGWLRGTYRGYPVEARVSKHDPTPSSMSSDASPDEVTIFQLRLGDVPGSEPWAFRRQPRLKPFAEPEYVFDRSYGGLGALGGLLGKVAVVPEGDPALEQRLHVAGLLDAIDGFGHGSSSFLPHVRYTPALHDEGGEFFCELELPRDTEPTPERFAELLERALQIVELNTRTNAG